MIEAIILRQRIPYPLNQHFKACDTVGDLLNGKAPRAYVVQCIKQTAITPFERAALLALIETTEINK